MRCICHALSHAYYIYTTRTSYVHSYVRIMYTHWHNGAFMPCHTRIIFTLHVHHMCILMCVLCVHIDIILHLSACYVHAMPCHMRFIFRLIHPCMHTYIYINSYRWSVRWVSVPPLFYPKRPIETQYTPGCKRASSVHQNLFSRHWWLIYNVFKATNRDTIYSKLQTREFCSSKPIFPPLVTYI